MAGHAILSPSGASKWLNCPPSARLETQFENKTSEYAEEGTLAHRLGECLIKRFLRLTKKADYEKELAIIKQSEFYNADMLDYCDGYKDFVIEHFIEAKSKTPDAKIILEEQIDLSKFIPESFGTIDTQIIADETLTIIDFKYGKGVAVEATENEQLMLYALGSLEKMLLFYGIKIVKLIIYQPRLDIISEWLISVEELKVWAEQKLIPTAKIAWEGKGSFVAGKHCRFCRARTSCRVHAEYQQEIAYEDFQVPPLLTDAEIVKVLMRAQDLKKWLDKVEEWALDEALKGRDWPYMKIVEGRSKRIYSNENAIADKLLDAGYASKDIYEAKLLGITKMTEFLGKADFNHYLNDLIIKPPGSPCLVPVTDKRPEFNSAINDFS